jgi:hypothetical protein
MKMDDLDDLPLFQPSNKTGLSEALVRGLTAYLNGIRSDHEEIAGINRAKTRRRGND